VRHVYDDCVRAAALLAALIAGTVACGASGGASKPYAPLSTLGALRPAPYGGDPGPELVPIPNAPKLASAVSRARPGRRIDGIKCESNPRVLFHVHAHLTVFVGGTPRQVPAGIGFWPPVGPQNYRNGQFGVTARNCWTWVSTRYPDGLVHIESPVRRRFVLGDLFDVWGQPLAKTRVGPARGAVTAIVNGRVWTADPRTIPLSAHAQIQLEVGKPLVAPQAIEFPGAF
jgi:hypothetical protein